jgi:hypothetical protein
VPIETFDLIVTDECHRSIYGNWRQVLEYFDSFIVGLTATPSVHTLGFFNRNIVAEYPYERSVVDGVNVGYEVYRIRTRIGEQGSRVEKGYTIPVRDKKTRAKRYGFRPVHRRTRRRSRTLGGNGSTGQAKLAASSSDDDRVQRHARPGRTGEAGVERISGNRSGGHYHQAMRVLPIPPRSRSAAIDSRNAQGRGVRAMMRSDLPPDFIRADVRFGPCVDGAALARTF